MKKLHKLLTASALLVFLNVGLITQHAFGQFAPPPPPPPDAKGSGGNRGPLEGEAPLGDGAWILITLVLGYGIHTYKVRKKNQDSEKE